MNREVYTKMQREATKQVAVDLEKSLLDDLQKIADRHHVTLSKLISTLVQAQLINMNLLEGLLDGKSSGSENIGA